jgi:UDP-N-acetylglucosamine acyltransferase
MNIIHHTAIIGENVKMGSGNFIGPYCCIVGDTTIGNNNKFESFCSIGTPAEHRDYFFNENGKLSIGNNNVFREFVTVNSGTKKITILGNDIVMLRNSHVGHDSILEDRVNLSCNVLIGGHSHIMEGSNFGLGSSCHQFSKIGAYSMIGMGSVITKKSVIEPGKVYVGSPCTYLKENLVGLERNNISNQDLKNLKLKYTQLTK